MYYIILEKLISQIIQIKSLHHKDIPIILVGNKIDLDAQRAVLTEEGKELAERYNIPFLEISVKDNINVSESFNTIIDEWRRKTGFILSLKCIDKIWNKLIHSDTSALKKVKDILSKRNNTATRQALLWHAIQHQFSKTAIWLIEKRLNQFELDYYLHDTTFFNEACSKGQKKVIKSMILNGIDYNVSNSKNQLSSYEDPEINYIIENFAKDTLVSLIRKLFNSNLKENHKRIVQRKITKMCLNGKYTQYK